MNSQPHLPGSRERRATVAIVTVLMLLVSVACQDSKGSTNAEGTQTKARGGDKVVDLRLHQHDIPPELAIDVGSFSIETDKKLKDHGNKKRRYEGANKALMMLIKVIRTDDGAVLYQNFDADDAAITFNTAANKSITVKKVTEASKDYVEVETTENDDLTYSEITNGVNGRHHKLEGSTAYVIKNITITKSGKTLFSYDGPGAGSEYSDKKYRVFIRIEKD